MSPRDVTGGDGERVVPGRYDIARVVLNVRRVRRIRRPDLFRLEVANDLSPASIVVSLRASKRRAVRVPPIYRDRCPDSRHPGGIVGETVEVVHIERGHGSGAGRPWSRVARIGLRLYHH